ncbi:MAG: DUF3168 domain-containing protein [Chloroflexi bacterium]|nr:DUF3168 domain-containing protein [Chloroflexota bacterium]
MYSKLTAASAVTDIVGTKIYPDAAPAKIAGVKIAPPYIVYSVVSVRHAQNMEGAGGQAFMRMQFDIVANTYGAMRTLAEAVRTTLYGYQGTVTVGADSVVLTSLLLDAEQSGYEDLDDGTFAGKRRLIYDFVIGYIETVPTP